jgi:hypothetical protein
MNGFHSHMYDDICHLNEQHLEESVNLERFSTMEMLAKVSVLFEINTSTANPATLHFKFIVCADVVKRSLLALYN